MNRITHETSAPQADFSPQPLASLLASQYKYMRESRKNIQINNYVDSE